jgi:hypothetical protein
MTTRQSATSTNHRRHNVEAFALGFTQDAEDEDYDLRDALEETVVREASFSEFRAALMQYRQRLH